MHRLDSSTSRARPKAVRVLYLLVAITAVFSLVYAIQYYAGSPIRLPVVSEIKSLDLAPDGRLVAAGATDGRVLIWSVPPAINTDVGKDYNVAGEELWPVRTLAGLDSPVLEVGFAADGATLIGVTQGGTARIWNLADGAVVQELELATGPLVDVGLAGNGRRVAVLGNEGTVQVWDLETEEELGTFGPGAGRSLAVALNADGTLVAAGDGTGVQIWDVETGEPIRTLAAYCADGTSETQEACAEAGKTWLGHTGDVTALALSPDSKLLASGSADTTIVFWDTGSGEAKWSSVGHWARVTTMVFSEDGELLLSGGKDYKSHTIRVVGGKSTATYEGHLATVTGAGFGPQQDTITTVSDDGTLRVWGTLRQYIVHLEWSRLGLQPVWGGLLAVWMLVSGILAVVALWGLARIRIWAHLLALALFLLGPIVVLGLPLLEVLTYPLRWGARLQIAWPLMVLLAWYVVVLAVLNSGPVALLYETSQTAALSEQLMISQRTRKFRLGIYGVAVWIALLVILYSVLRRFSLDIAFMGSFLKFIMLGSGITFLVSALSILLAVVLALVGALGRLSRNPIANAASGFYISLIRGTPLLVQIYIWYLGLPRLNIVLDPMVAGILALGVNYGAYMTEIFRAGIQAVSHGQREAAQALGMSGGQTFRRIILPQAFRIVIPPIGNEFIAMMKDSSLVSVMAVQELTWRASKIGRQYFRGMETFIIAAAFYWILTVVFQMLQGRLEEYMARGERK